MRKVEFDLMDGINISLALEDRAAFLGGKGAPAAADYEKLRKKWDSFWYGEGSPQDAVMTEAPE